MSWTPISSIYVFAGINGEAYPVGILAKVSSGYQFAYAKSWLSRQGAFSVDPLHLPLSDKQWTQSRLWGCFEDATPDTWGQKVLLATHSQKPQNPLEWLLASRGTGAGCLLFSMSRNRVNPPASVPQYEELETLIGLADEIDKGELPAGIDEALARLMWHGSSMGGARPKVTVSLDGQQWIAKLSRRDDVFNQPRAEFASLNMAAEAGIRVPGHQLRSVGNRDILLVQRFDRVGGHREHYLSANSLIAADRVREGDIEGPMSYLRIASVIQKISQDASADLTELYRRMVFNIAICNTDDHLRNHGVLLQGSDQYRLSPAFDLIPHPNQTDLMALIVGAGGREATFANALSMCQRFGLQEQDAEQIIDEVLAVTTHAEDRFLAAGMTPVDARVLASVCKATR